jgi:hypothetical protein
MSEAGDGTDLYKLYAVVVHVDMLNASFYGHYICYTKDFRGNWYRIDDCKVVLSLLVFFSLLYVCHACLSAQICSIRPSVTVALLYS